MKDNKVKYGQDQSNDVRYGEVLITPALAQEMLDKLTPGANTTLEERMELLERIEQMMISPSSN